MKYKDIKSMAHNFSHSFLSYENYVDGEYVVEDLKRLAREANGETVAIHWVPETLPNPDKFTKRTKTSISYYRAWLPKHANSHGVELEHIREFRTELFMKSSHQMCAQAYVLDDRGKEHVSEVLF